MKILSVKVGPPADDYSAWIRKIKIANIIRSLGHEMDFVIYTRSDEFNDKILDDISFPFEIVKVSRLNIYFKHFKILKQKDYDIVFCNGQATQAVLFLTKLTGVKFILDKHGDIVKELLLLYDGFKFNLSFIFWYLFFRLIDFLNLNFSDKILCVSHEMVEDVYKRGLRKDRAAYVTNGINLNFFEKTEIKVIEKMKKDFNISDKLIFLYAGACEKWQGVSTFINAARILKNETELVFIIVGGKRKGREDNLIYVPKVSQKEVQNYYAMSDVLVLPRPSHPATEIAAPTKFPEYCAMGKPILTTNVGDASLFVKKYNCGVVVDSDDPQSMVDGILKLKKSNPNELEIMGLNSRKLAEEEFSIEKMAKDLSSALEN